MKNDTGAVILLIVLIVAAFLLLLPRITRLLGRHGHEEKDDLRHILAPSVLAICLCAICLCGTSWAWFTASTSTGVTTMQSSSYKLLYQVGDDAAELATAGTTYTLTAETCEINLTAAGTAGATGYCSVRIGDETYYTQQIFVDDTAFTFTITAPAGTEIILTPKWGTYAGTATIQNGATITVSTTQQSAPQTPDSTETTEPDTNPEDTTPVVPEPTDTAANFPELPDATDDFG